MEKIRTGLLVLLVLTGMSCGLWQPYGAMQAPMPTRLPTPPIQSPTRLPTHTPSPTPLTCTVFTGAPGGSLNLRSGPGTSYSVLVVLTEGQAVTVLPGVSENWIQIQTGTYTGWINSTYCKKGQ